MKNTKTFTVKNMAITGLMIAVGIVLPLAFHSLPQGLGGRAILPMHIPILLAGLICGPVFGLAAGILTPILSYFILGMPMPVFLYPMLFELPIYGAVAGLLMRYLPVRHLYGKLYISLITAMLAGRVTFGAANALLFSAGEYSTQMWVTATLVTALPGIVIQLIAIPSIVVALQRERLIGVYER
ncbi:MAG: ECF transporter S component [Oscillospiraceae bacterium]|nr:ECF transporter S component [Oscillospiraceae bacterium]